MKRLLLLAFLAGLIVTCATEETTDTSVQTEEQRVLAVEDQWINAEINRDEATLRRVIDDRFVYNSNSGNLSGKEDLIKNVLSWNMTGQTF